MTDAEQRLLGCLQGAFAMEERGEGCPLGRCRRGREKKFELPAPSHVAAEKGKQTQHTHTLLLPAKLAHRDLMSTSANRVESDPHKNNLHIISLYL